ncbi:unnamed protein product [Rhizopus stolonifer]
MMLIRALLVFRLIIFYHFLLTHNSAGSQPQDGHKHFSIKLFDEGPQATRQDAADALAAAFEGFSLKGSQVGTSIRNECNLTVKRITRHPKARKMAANRHGLHE